MHKTQLSAFILFFIASLCLSACRPFIIDRDPCIGWECAFTGTVFQNVATEGNRLGNVPVKLMQISQCSPTAGEQTAITDADGKFSFIVFLHDTDSFVITINNPGYAPSQIKFGGFDCLSCLCPPWDIVLAPE